jgi:parallel beta-helix repeat protein
MARRKMLSKRPYSVLILIILTLVLPGSLYADIFGTLSPNDVNGMHDYSEMRTYVLDYSIEITGAATGKADVLFLTDTTGSMGSYIGGIKTALSGILSAIDACLPDLDINYAVADYKDYTDGGKYTTYGVNLRQPFTSDTVAVQTAINGLSAVGGGDTPESQLKAIVNIAGNWLTASGDLGFNGRADAQKIIIWAGDAPGHIAGDSPAGYYPSLDGTIAALNSQGILAFALNTMSCNDGIDQPYGGIPRRQATEITSATGGTLFCNVGTGGPSIDDAIVAAITSGVETLNNITLTLAGSSGDFLIAPISQTITGSWTTEDSPVVGSFSFDATAPGFDATADFNMVLLGNGAVLASAKVHLTAVEIITKTDDVNDGDCVMPGQEINYTLTYNFTSAGDTNVLLIDYLPDELDYNSSWPAGDYNAADRTVTWNIGTALPGTSASFTLNGIVNYYAEPCGVITNTCLLSGDMTDLTAEVNTPLCFWTRIIYVDHNATGLNNGLSWDDAFLDLQSALNRTAVDGNSEIWVASGTYKPSVPDASGYRTFTLINDIPLYGHFAGNEISLSQRDFNNPNNETILSGTGLSVRNVVTASGLSQKNIIDGFTITGATVSTSAGVKIENACLRCTNCLIKSNGNRGIYAISSTFIIDNCILQNMGAGIYSNGSVFTALNCIIWNNNGGVSVSNYSSGMIAGSKIFKHSIHGIEFDNTSNAFIINNWIYGNTMSGISLGAGETKIIRNNTIFSNRYGIDVGTGTAPIISNCIVWNNTDDLRYCSATYSCIKNNDSGTGNIHCDPCFVSADGNDFHLRPLSLCIDAGDPNFNDFNETDIDADPRITDGDQNGVTVVDIGADEFHFPWADFDKNDIVNFIDFAIFAPSWQATDPAKSFDSDNDVDMEDLAIFCDYWLFEGLI